MNKRNRRLMAGLRRQRVGNGPARVQGVQYGPSPLRQSLGAWLAGYSESAAVNSYHEMLSSMKADLDVTNAYKAAREQEMAGLGAAIIAAVSHDLYEWLLEKYFPDYIKSNP